MKLKDLMKIDTPCEAGLAFIAEHPEILDMEMSDLWDKFRDSQWDFRGWCVKHAPMSREKLRAAKLVKAAGIVRKDGTIDQARNHDKDVADMCFGWMKNPYREAL